MLNGDEFESVESSAADNEVAELFQKVYRSSRDAFKVRDRRASLLEYNRTVGFQHKTAWLINQRLAIAHFDGSPIASSFLRGSSNASERGRRGATARFVT